MYRSLVQKASEIFTSLQVLIELRSGSVDATKAQFPFSPISNHTKKVFCTFPAPGNNLQLFEESGDDGSKEERTYLASKWRCK